MDGYLIGLIATCSLMALFFFLVVLFISMALICYVSCNRCYPCFKSEKVKGEKTVLITGGTSGIGLALAKLFAKDEYNIVIVAENENDLLKTKCELEKMVHNENTPISCTVKTECVDLSILKDVISLTEKFDKDGLNVDVFVCNAGFGKVAKLEDHSNKEIVEMVNCNAIAATLLLRYFAKKMKLKKAGGIAILSSMTAFSPSPRMSVYAATKTYLRSLALALNHELKKDNVSVTCVCPGIVKTNWHGRAIEGGKIAKFQKMGSQTPDECAFETYRSIIKKEREVVTGCGNWFLARIMYKFLSNTILMNGQDHYNQLIDK